MIYRHKDSSTCADGGVNVSVQAILTPVLSCECPRLYKIQDSIYTTCKLQASFITSTPQPRSPSLLSDTAVHDPV
jgi:hypothetical protein